LVFGAKLSFEMEIMSVLPKTVILLATAVILVLWGQSFLAFAQTMVYEETGATLSTRFDIREKPAEAKWEIASAEGTLIKKDLAGFDSRTTVEVLVTLTVGEGSFQAVFREGDNVSLDLSVQNGTSAEGRGKVTIDSSGALPYEVTAVGAKNVVMTVIINPPAQSTLAPEAK
jgi:hypothetical protein